MSTMRAYRDAVLMLLRDANGVPVQLSGVELARTVTMTEGRQRPEPKEVWMGSMTLVHFRDHPPRGFSVRELSSSGMRVEFRRIH